MLSGLIVKAQSGFFTVETERGLLVCQLRGRLKQERRSTDLAAVGDRVEVEVQEDGTGTIEAVLPRQSALSRQSNVPGRDAEQVLVANPDQAVFVFACANPSPHLRMLDRFLLIAEQSRIPALVCANKVDLVSRAQAEALFAPYPGLGYPVLFTSARSGEGVAALRERLRGRLSVLAGSSGVGKSSLLNAVQPGLGLAARAVSAATTKGRHTTVAPELLPLAGGGYVADTPGLRALALWDVEPEELDGLFPELRPLVAGCEFSDCTHLHEPGCAVLAAVRDGRVHPERYEFYRRLRAEGN